jgi:hypothetical protein
MIDTNRLAFGIHPNSVLSVAEMVECARLAEAKGFAATWVGEGHRGDVFALLSALAMSTSKIRNPARTRAQPLGRRDGDCHGRRNLRRSVHARPRCGS